THCLNRISISHQDNGYGLICSPELSHHSKHILQADTMLQCPLGRPLYSRSVRHWIRKWYSQFDQINTGLYQLMHQRDSSRGIRITSCNERNKCCLVFCFEQRKNRCDTSHLTDSPIESGYRETIS